MDAQTGLATGEVEHPGLAAGLSLALIAVWAFSALCMLIVVPIRRLRDDLEASILDGPRLFRRSLTRETERLAGTVCVGGTGNRRTVSALHTLWLVGLAVVAWLVTTSMMVGSDHGARFAVAEEGQRATDAVAASVRHELEGGLAGLGAVAAENRAMDDPAGTTEEALAARPIFRAVQVLDSEAHALASAGNSSASFASAPGPGITILNTSGAEPVLVAASPLDSGRILVGQYDIRALNDRLRVADSPISVVDGAMRTILSNVGYQAFTELANPALREVASQAASGHRTSPVAPEAEGTVLTAQRIGFEDATARLELVAVAEHDTAAMVFAHDATRRAAFAISSVAGGFAVVFLSWIYISAVRPLRRLGLHAEGVAAVAAGGVAPEPVAPERLNESGAIAAALNRRLVEAVRARTASADAFLSLPTEDPATVAMHRVDAIPTQRISPHPLHRRSRPVKLVVVAPPRGRTRTVQAEASR
ncbi:hypothetical protein [Actinomycetospora chibensis]|uniref:HAMP domain-containing protein n=1 Tax=Actinomycetospora chibensis TaxID=663606 RepID=A0ABV9RKT0_9PSEU|nr:hypothetical protein [Actinomycetospora chibensis]MDD7926104.1 hypothetical protein [Actinomycetospora chibensis]